MISLNINKENNSKLGHTFGSFIFLFYSLLTVRWHLLGLWHPRLEKLATGIETQNYACTVEGRFCFQKAEIWILWVFFYWFSSIRTYYQPKRGFAEYGLFWRRVCENCSNTCDKIPLIHRSNSSHTLEPLDYFQVYAYCTWSVIHAFPRRSLVKRKVQSHSGPWAPLPQIVPSTFHETIHNDSTRQQWWRWWFNLDRQWWQMPTPTHVDAIDTRNCSRRFACCLASENLHVPWDEIIVTKFMQWSYDCSNNAYVKWCLSTDSWWRCFSPKEFPRSVQNHVLLHYKFRVYLWRLQFIYALLHTQMMHIQIWRKLQIVVEKRKRTPSDRSYLK